MRILHVFTRNARFAALSLGLISSAALANEAALYGPTAPPGSAFVRTYNAGSGALSVTVGPVSLNDVSPKGSSDFKFLPPGSYTADAKGKTLPVKLGADQYYTLVRLPGGELDLVDEPAFKNKQKAMIRLQNLSDSPLTLKTSDGKTEVIKPVAADGRGEREINPVKVRLALFSGDKKISDLDALVLERGEVVCLYVTGKGGSLSPVWVKRPQTGG